MCVYIYIYIYHIYIYIYIYNSAVCLPFGAGQPPGPATAEWIRSDSTLPPYDTVHYILYYDILIHNI